MCSPASFLRASGVNALFLALLAALFVLAGALPGADLGRFRAVAGRDAVVLRALAEFFRVAALPRDGAAAAVFVAAARLVAGADFAGVFRVADFALGAAVRLPGETFFEAPRFFAAVAVRFLRAMDEFSVRGDGDRRLRTGSQGLFT